jgi:hypothetical protein
MTALVRIIGVEPGYGVFRARFEMARAQRLLAAHGELDQDSAMPTPDQPQGLHVSIIIDATFGSQVQRDVSLKVLKEFLAAWTQNVTAAHKKNRVTTTVKEEQPPDLIQ